jgi:formylglycine-generating enzyme required for sulfatase activity
MHGNVWEWTRDAYRARLPGGRDPIPLDQNPKAVFRGGSWWDGESYCRSAFRRNHPADTRDGNLGFRIALVRAGK